MQEQGWQKPEIFREGMGAIGYALRSFNSFLFISASESPVNIYLLLLCITTRLL
jgi:hypothetical protein